eukprot:scaffold19903_cov64-Phaeocystis_antarctica.AAC.11
MYRGPLSITTPSVTTVCACPPRCPLASNTVISAALPKASRSRPANDAPDGPPPTMPTESASAPTEEWRRIDIIAWRCKIVDMVHAARFCQAAAQPRLGM